MKFKLVILFFLGYVSAENNGNCALSYNQSTITPDQWKFGFQVQDKLRDDAANGTVVAIFQTSNITNITTSTSQFFTPVFNSNTGLISIVLSEPFDETKDTLQNQIFIKVYFQCITDTANIYIYIPLEDINDHSPTFNSAQYSYLLPMPFPGGIDIAAAFGNIYATDVDFTNTRIDFSLDEIGNKYFNVTLSRTEGKKFFAMLKSKTRIDVEDTIVFNITATDSGTPPLQSSVQMTITPDSKFSTPISPIFQYPIYISNVEEVNSAKEIPLDINLEEGYDTNLTIQLKDINSGDWSKYFTAITSGSSVNIQLVNQLPEDLLNVTNAVIILEAIRMGADHTGQTALLITGPCSSSSSDYPTAAPVTPMPCPGISLHFLEPEYTVIVNKNQSGIIAEFKIKVISDHMDELLFGIYSGDETVKKIFRIGPSDGILYADQPLVDPPQFEFNVTAEINSTQEKASVKVTVKIVNPTSDIQTPQFTKALEIHHIYEETTGDQIAPGIIFPSSHNLSCSFKIKSQYPSGGFFSLSESIGVVTITNKIDREADIFVNMTQAVITLNLQIICSSAKSTTFQVNSVANNDGNIETFPNDPLQTTLMVYIDDTNDNIPNFGFQKMTVGYPVKELGVRLQPKSIATVKANDKDLGLNGEIKYSLLPNLNDQVMIHPLTGAIYPLESFKFEDMTLNVLAEDQNGNQGCNNATLELEIKILKAEDVTILWIEDAVIEDLSTVLTKLKTATQYDIQIIDSAIISDNSLPAILSKSLKSDDQSTSNASTKTLLRLIVYALDADGQVVSDEKILKDLENVTFVKTATSATALLPSEVKEENTVLIAIIIILASVLIIVLFSVTIALYLVYVRPRRVKGFTYTNEFGSKDRINNNMEPVDQSNSPMDTSESDIKITSSLDTLTRESSALPPPPVITLTESLTLHSDPSVLPTPPVPSTTTPASPVSDKKSPAPRERKRSQPVRGDLIPDPDKLLAYRKHKPKEDEDLPDPTVPGGGAPMPREPRQPGGEPIERKRSTVRFSPVIESIDQ